MTQAIKILCLCTGNICRSPMAVGIWQKMCGDEDGEYLVSSAGVRGIDGQPAHQFSRKVMADRGIDISKHRARTVTPQLLIDSDWIITMDLSQAGWVKHKMPGVSSKVYLLGYTDNMEIKDPMGGEISDFQSTANIIGKYVEIWTSVGEKEFPAKDCV